MAFVSEMFDQMRDLLDDAGDTQISFATKKLYLNRGIARMWPRVWRVRTADIPLTEGTYEYTASADIAFGGLLSVEIETEEGTDEYRRFSGYDLLPGDEDQTAVLRITEAFTGSLNLRVTYAAPIPLITAASYAAAGSETWTGPDRAIGIPVFYAMAMSVLRKVDNRQDTNRYSTLVAENGVTDNDMMSLSQMYMGQYELELTEAERPLPIARD